MDLTIIQNKIYEIRGERVMLDRDLAEMFRVTTGNLNKAVKRNIERFPERFMFQLSKDEFDMIFQNGTSKRGGTRKLPFAFTEHGVAMLSGVLNSDIAVNISIQIIDAFVAMRRYITVATTQNKELSQVKEEIRELKQYIEEVFADYNDINEDTAMQLELINQTLAELSAKQNIQRTREKIGFRK